jgi:prevent-host-death family protein
LAVAKAKLSRLVDDVGSVDTAVTITRHGVPAAVLLSVEEYDGWQETLAIRDDPALVREIRHGLRALQRTRKLYTLEELFDPAGGR